MFCWFQVNHGTQTRRSKKKEDSKKPTKKKDEKDNKGLRSASTSRLNASLPLPESRSSSTSRIPRAPGSRSPSVRSRSPGSSSRPLRPRAPSGVQRNQSPQSVASERRGRSPESLKGAQGYQSSPAPGPSTERQEQNFGGARPRRRLPQLRPSNASPVSSRSSLRSPSSNRSKRKLPPVAFASDESVESGLGETFIASSQEALDSSHSGPPVAEAPVRVLGYASTQTQETRERSGTVESTVTGSDTSAPRSAHSLKKQQEKQKKKGGKSKESRSRSGTASTETNQPQEDSSENDVVRAILEADEAMQEMMAAAAPPLSHSAGHLHDWFQRGHLTGNTTPIQVHHDDTSLTDSAKQALKKNPQSADVMRQHHTWNGETPNSNLTRIPIVFDDADNVSEDSEESGKWAETTRSSGGGKEWAETTRSSGGGFGNHSLRMQNMEVVEHEVTINRQILKPRTNLDSPDDEDEEEEEEEREESEEHEEGDTDDDAGSWGSGVTEPDPPSSGVETLDSATQTLRHRTTQTPENVGTQTHGRPNSRQDVLDEESEEGDDEEEVESESDNPTNPSLMRTMAHQQSPVNRTLKVTGSRLENQPEYLQQYQNYIEQFDGTASGPFVPRDTQLEDDVFRRESSSQLPPRSVPRDANGGPHDY